MIDTALFWQCRGCRKHFSIGLTTLRVRDVSGAAVRFCIDCDEAAERVKETP